MRLLSRATTLAATISACVATGTIKLPWTTDDTERGERLIGPDGPWQAVVASVGNGTGTVDLSFWPSGIGMSQILGPKAGGSYAPDNSSSAIKSGFRQDSADEWLSGVFPNQTADGYEYYDDVSAGPTFPFHVNASLNVMDEWEIHYPGGRHYTPEVGILGLGPSWEADYTDDQDVLSNSSRILPKLKADGKVASEFFSVHMGSAALYQPGSLVLGGYEQNRALGPVGIFPFGSERGPKAFLLDVALAVQTGTSPFATDIGSVWQGLQGDSIAEEVTRNEGGKLGSAVVKPNPAGPYIYLPLGTCEAAASHLPVTWNEELGLYTWNEDDPQFSRIVQSPAYMAFILSDTEAANLTIKVPFQLLNLTLEAPLVDKPTPYFPCKSLNTTQGFWMLGRAFLQAAFFAIDFEHHAMLLAQAPGPDMDQSVMRTFEPDNTTILTNSIDSFEQSWASTWTVLAAEGTKNATVPPAKHNHMSSGAIAGISVGSAAAFIAAAAIGIWCWRNRRRRNSPKLKNEAAEPLGPEITYGWKAERQDQMQELREDRAVYETGTPLRHEMEVPRIIHEPAGHQIYEMPNNSPHERWMGR